MMGRGAAVLSHEVTVTFRRLRPHEARTVSPGKRVIVAIADTLDGPEEQRWLVPVRQAKAALNPHRHASRKQCGGSDRKYTLHFIPPYASGTLKSGTVTLAHVNVPSVVIGLSARRRDTSS